VQGIATVGSWTLGPTAGSGNNKLTATVTGLSGSPVEFTATATPGSAGKLDFITEPPTSGTSGQSLTPQPVLQLYDSDNNAVSTPGVTVTATLSQGTGVLTNATAVTLSNGRATFSGLRISGVAGTYRLTFSATDVAGITSDEITLAAGAAAKLGMVTQPSATVPNGQVFPTQPVVQLRDADENPVSQSGVTVLAALVGPNGTLGGGTSVNTDANGQAKFSGLKITGDVGNYQILFSSTVTTGTASSVIALTPGAVSVANSSVSPVSGSFTAGDANGFSFTVTAEDQSQNPVPNASIVLSGFGAGSMTPSSAQTGTDGTAIFVFTSTGAGSHQITVTAGGVVLSQKPSVTVAVGPAASMTASAVPGANAVAGSAASPAPSVLVTDAFGNPVSGASVHFAVSGGGGSISGSGDVQTGSNGVAAAGTWTLGTSPGVNTLTVTSGSLTGSPVTFTVTTSAGAASQIAANVTPSANGVVGTNASPSPSVIVTDALGNPVAGENVHFAIGSGGGSFAGPADVQTDANGTASSGTWTLGSSPGTNTLTATSGSLTGSPVTFTVTATAGAATSIQSNAVLPASGTVGTAVSPDPSVIVKDNFGNPVANVIVHFAVDPVSGSISGGPDVLTDANGLASPGTWTLSTQATQNTLTATASGLTGSPLTFTVNANAGSAASISASSALDLSGAAGSTQNAIVLVQDSYGNPVVGASVTFSVTAGAGSIPPDAVSTDADGLAQVAWTLDAAPGANTLEASAAGVPGVITFTATGN
jgi:hypothetical protein